MNKLIISTI